MKYTDEEMDSLMKRIYNGEVNPRDLPEDVYLEIADYLLDGVKKGFGGGVSFTATDEALYASLQDNIYLFSAAKTFQQTLEMSEALTNDKGELLSFTDFKEAATNIFIKYNGGDIDDEVKPGWLEAEYNTAISQASHARRWNDIEKQKETFPYLIRNEIDDASECEECSAINGVCLPVDHPFWNENAGDLHFNCRGFVDQLEKEEGKKAETDNGELDERLDNRTTEAFMFNPGKSEEIFATEGKAQHPYFNIPKEYAKFAENNFNLTIPDEE